MDELNNNINANPDPNSDPNQMPNLFDMGNSDPNSVPNQTPNLFDMGNTDPNSVPNQTPNLFDMGNSDPNQTPNLFDMGNSDPYSNANQMPMGDMNQNPYGNTNQMPMGDMNQNPYGMTPDNGSNISADSFGVSPVGQNQESTFDSFESQQLNANASQPVSDVQPTASAQSFQSIQNPEYSTNSGNSDDQGIDSILDSYDPSVQAEAPANEVTPVQDVAPISDVSGIAPVQDFSNPSVAMSSSEPEYYQNTNESQSIRNPILSQSLPNMTQDTTIGSEMSQPQYTNPDSMYDQPMDQNQFNDPNSIYGQPMDQNQFNDPNSMYGQPMDQNQFNDPNSMYGQPMNQGQFNNPNSVYGQPMNQNQFSNQGQPNMGANDNLDSDYTMNFVKNWMGTLYDNAHSKKFSWPAALFGGIYFLYRKMYATGLLFALLLVIINCLVVVLTTKVGVGMLALSPILTLAIFFVCGFGFYPMYRNFVRGKLNTLKKTVPDNNQLLNIAREKGGVSVLAVVLYCIITPIIVGIFATIAISAGIISFVSNASNNVTNTLNEVVEEAQTDMKSYNFLNDYSVEYDANTWFFNNSTSTLTQGDYSLVYAQQYLSDFKNLFNVDVTAPDGRSNLLSSIVTSLQSQAAAANLTVDTQMSNFAEQNGVFYSYIDIIANASTSRYYLILLPEKDILFEFVLSVNDTTISSTTNLDVLSILTSVSSSANAEGSLLGVPDTHADQNAIVDDTATSTNSTLEVGSNEVSNTNVNTSNTDANTSNTVESTSNTTTTDSIPVNSTVAANTTDLDSFIQ